MSLVNNKSDSLKNSMEQFTATTSGRLDKILAVQLDVSRNQVEKLVKEGLVNVNDKTVTKGSYKVVEGDEVSYSFKEAEKRVAPPIDFDIDILYEDDYILVVNKPSGLVVHPAPSVKEPTLVDWLIHKGISLSTIGPPGTRTPSGKLGTHSSTGPSAE